MNDSGHLGPRAPRIPQPYRDALVPFGTAIFGASAATAVALVHYTSLPTAPTIFGIFVLSVVAVVLTHFHLLHTPLKTTEPGTAGRLSLVGALAGMGGVQTLARAFNLSDPMGTGFLLTAPLLAQAMLVSALVGPAVSMFVLTVTCFLMGVSGALPISTLAVSWLGGAIACHAVNPLKRRNDLLRAIGIVGLTNAIIACGATATQVSTVMPVVSSATWAALAAVIACSIFWMSIAVIERFFNIISDWSLLELCSPDHPLLRELVLRAPGTYAHSVMVGNLAEGAAREIGANPTLCRALAYFHDIGKLARPSHFIENQQNENVHDHLPPRLSAKIIAQHVADGVESARAHKLPRILVDGIRQHHGTGLMSFFYRRLIEQENLEPSASLEAEFRYSGPRPQTKEIAILLLADSVEAMSRVIPRGQTEALEVAVGKIIEERRADGQLDECDLTFKEVQTIRRAFLRTLNALRHERIAYPEDLEHAPSPAPHLDLKELEATRDRATGE